MIESTVRRGPTITEQKGKVRLTKGNDERGTMMDRSRDDHVRGLQWAFALASLFVAGLVLARPVDAFQVQPSTQFAGSESLVLGPGDVLEVSVWPDGDGLSGQFPVEETGYVYLPFLGRVLVEGVSIEDLRQQLREGYQDIRSNAVVSVTPVYGVGVVGSVQQPGVYQVTPAMTLFDVIFLAGGFAPGADQEKVRIVRGGRAIEVDAYRVLQGQGLPDPVALRLESGDQVVVPSSGGFNFRSFLQSLGAVASLVLVIERISRR